MIKAIIFDYGGVVTAGGALDDLPKKLAKNLDIPFDRAKDIVGPENWRPFMKGLNSEDDFWDKLERNLGKSIDDSLRHVWNTWEEMKPQPEMVTLIKELKKDHTIGLLSNTIPPTADDIKLHGGYDLFDFIVLSYEVKMAKPDIDIYQKAMTNLPGLRPEEIVFIDDQERCLVPARELGMRTILAVNPAQISQDLRLLLN